MLRTGDVDLNDVALLKMNDMFIIIIIVSYKLMIINKHNSMIT